MVLSLSSQENMFNQATPFLTAGNRIPHPQAGVSIASTGYYPQNPTIPNQVAMAPTQHSFSPLLPPASQLSPSYGWSNYPYNMWHHSVLNNSPLDFLQHQASTGPLHPSPLARSDSGYSQDSSPESFTSPAQNLPLSSPDGLKQPEHSELKTEISGNLGKPLSSGSCRFSPKNSVLTSEASRISQGPVTEHPSPSLLRPMPGSYNPSPSFPCPNFPQRDSGIGLSASCYFPSGQVNMERVPEYSWMRSSRPSGPGTNNVRVRTRDKYRMVYSDLQRIELEKEFYTSKYINTGRKTELSRQLGLTERQIKIWFQNRRAKERKCLRKSCTEESDGKCGESGVPSGVTVKTECTSTCKDLADSSTPSSAPFVFPSPLGLFSSTLGHSGSLPDSTMTSIPNPYAPKS